MSLLRSFLHRRTITTSLLSLNMLKFRPPADLLGSTSSAHSSCMASPSLDSVSEDEETDVGYFKQPHNYSPDSTNYASDAESEAAESDVTLDDDAEAFMGFGHPLERIPPGTSGDILKLNCCLKSSHEAIYHPGHSCSSWCASPTESQSSMTSSIADYHAIIDDLLLRSPTNPFDEQDPQNFVTLDASPSIPFSALQSKSSLMIKRVARDSTELSLLLDLNSAKLRQDPWNPCPHILQVIDHDPSSSYLYLCMERLNEFNAPPMSTVAQYMDFFRQILEGLSFLHEHSLVGFSCSDPNSYMVDLSSGAHSNNASFVSLLSPATSRGQPHDMSAHSIPSGHRVHRHHHRPHSAKNSGVIPFDRSSYPVRYYFVNFANARRIQEVTMTRSRTVSVPVPSSSQRALSSKRPCPFKQDVKELGNMIDRMLTDVPSPVNTKFKALVKAMTVGGFGADDSRQLFEVLCQSLEPGVFEMAVRRGAGLRSHSVDLGTANGAMSGSTYAPSMVKGDFGFEPDIVALSS